MKLSTYSRLMMVVRLVGLVGATASDNRGIFTPNACDTGDSPGESNWLLLPGAVAAIYVDSQGNPLGLFAEDLPRNHEQQDVSDAARWGTRWLLAEATLVRGQVQQCQLLRALLTRRRGDKWVSRAGATV